MRRTLVAVTLAASVLTATPSGLFEPLWRFLSSIWNQPLSKEGCGLDPLGRCKTAPQPLSKNGCGADPLGRCSTAPQTELDSGCGFDPNGCPKSGS